MTETGRMSAKHINSRTSSTEVRDHSQDGITYRVRTTKYETYITISVEVLSIDGKEINEGHFSSIYKRVNDQESTLDKG